MASRIKGITVEIGGDTTKLQTALQGVNKEIKNTQSQLKDVEKLLKLDPGNTELLAQKQRLLSDAIGETREKLETLKTAAAQANEALSKGEISKDQYDALQRELIATEEELKRLEEQAKKSSVAMESIAAAGTKIKEAGGKVESAGEALLPVSVAVAGLGTAAVTTAASFESSMSQVQATMGITKDSMSKVNGQSVNTMEALSDLAKKMGSETAFSASECAEALNYLALAGYDTQQMIDTLPTVLNLAAAGDIDLASASDMVTDAMSALGLEVSDAGVMVDQMAKTASSTNTSVAQLGEGILTIGATAKSIKGGTAELNTALGILANNGIKSAEGGTHLRNIILSLQNPTDSASKLFKKLGVEVYDSSGNMRSLNDILGDLNSSMGQMSEQEKDGIISKIFNKTDLASVNALLANTGSTWDSLQNSIANSAGAAGQMAETQLDNLQGQLTILKSALEGLAISIGELLMPYIKAIVSAIQSFVDWLNSLDEGAQKIIVTVGLLIAALGPVLIVVGKVMTGIGSIMQMAPAIMGAITAVGTALKGLFAIMLANPIGIIIAAVAALVAGLLYLWNTNEGFRAAVLEIWESIKEGISNAISALSTFLTETWNNIMATAVSVWTGLTTFLSETWNFLYTTVSSIFTNIWNTLVLIFTNIFTSVSSTVGDIKNTIVDGLTAAFDFIRSIPGEAFAWGRDMIQGIIDGISSMVGAVIDTVKGVADSISSFLHFSKPDKGPLSEYETWMPDFMNGLAKGIKDSSGLVDAAIADVANGMVISPNVSALSYKEEGRGILDGIKKLMDIQGSKDINASSGDIVIPVYIGTDMIDEIIISASQRMNLKSGGR